MVEPLYYVEMLSGGYVGDLELRLEWRAGDGELLGVRTETMSFEPGRTGARTSDRLQMAARETGLSWLEFSLGGRFVTKLPVVFEFETVSSSVGHMSVGHSTDHGGPYLSIATFAEQFEASGSLRTLERTIHALRMRASEPGIHDWRGRQVRTDLRAVLRFIPGAFLGQKRPLVTWVHPDGGISDPEAVALNFVNAAVPVDLLLDVNVDFEKPGPYELRVTIDGKRVAALPLELSPDLARGPDSD